MIRSILCVAVLIGAFGLGGCIAVGGTTNQPTRGQELIDLKTALDRGGDYSGGLRGDEGADRESTVRSYGAHVHREVVVQSRKRLRSGWHG
jgi:hypothetical protein